MSDMSQGPGWWQASDGKWYPPEQSPGPAPTTPPVVPPTAPPTGAPDAGYGTPSPGYGTPPGPGVGGPSGTSYGAPGGPAAYGAPAYGAPVGGQAELAEWPIRVASYTIDWLAIGILANFISFGISTALGSLLSLLGLAFGIYNAYLNGSTGQSVGKKIMGTKVLGEATGQPIGGGMGIVRQIAHILDAITCFIGFLFPLWDPKRQTFADKIMKTVVVTGLPKQSFGDAIKP